MHDVETDDVAAWVRHRLDEWTGADVRVAELLCDRHAQAPERIGLFYEDRQGTQSRYTFVELLELSQRFAGVLSALGVGRGDRVATMLSKTPELMVAVLGLWRLGAVHLPLFPAFGPDAVHFRTSDSETSVVITSREHRHKVPEEPGLRVVLVDAVDRGVDVAFWPALEAAEPVKEAASTRADELIVLIYTSGTTGLPKGVQVPARALAAFETYMRLGLDVREGDVFWNVADPGWAYGLYYGILGPFLLGKAPLYVNRPFDPKGAVEVMEKYGVTNLAGAPTMYRSLRAAGIDARGRVALRAASSAGEPLSPDVITWAEEHLGVPILDHYGQTELGMMVNNHQAPQLRRPLKLGSMGEPMPGFRAVILDDANEEVAPGTQGELAIDVPASPLFWFPGYWKAPEWSESRYVHDGRYYVTGDAASSDADGYFFFLGRADDLISSSGYRIGPFEVESTLLAHPAVAEAAVVGKPDELRGEVVYAYVVLIAGHEPSEEMAQELQAFVKSHLAAHAYPRGIEFVDEVPKTPSGKIQRFLLRG